MLIQIDGWFAGGKSVLWSLLDGHSDVFVCPVHEYSFAGFLNQSNEDEWITKKHTTTLRRILSRTEFYKFEKLYWDKVLPISLSSDVSIDIPYDVNFYEYDEQLFRALDACKEWSIETIVNKIYQVYYEIYTRNNVHPKYYAMMSHPTSYMLYEQIPTLLPGMKSILVKRGVKNIIASRMNRNERPKDLNEAKAFRVPFDILMKRNDVEQILDFYNTYELLQDKYPDNFLVVSFDELITNTKNTMSGVSKFLGVGYEEILALPTRDGKELRSGDVSFIGTENDDYRNLLGEDEIAVIESRIRRYNIFKKPYNVFSLKDQMINLKNRLRPVLYKS